MATKKEMQVDIDILKDIIDAHTSCEDCPYDPPCLAIDAGCADTMLILERGRQYGTEKKSK